MKEPTSEDRLFGTLAIVLLSLSLLVPWILMTFAAFDIALGFGVTGILLAFVSGIIGWKHKAGQVSVYIIGVFVGFSLGVLLIKIF